MKQCRIGETWRYISRNCVEKRSAYHLLQTERERKNAAGGRNAMIRSMRRCGSLLQILVSIHGVTVPVLEPGKAQLALLIVVNA